MRYFALACDYDGTLATHGVVSEATVAALERLRASGRKLLLVTGRDLDDLIRAFPQVHLFDRVVAENGGVLYNTATREVKPLADKPSDDLVRELQRRGIQPLSVGRVIVATWEPHEQTVLQIIHDLNLELQVIFNKGAVMVLPSGVNKATGMLRALESLKLSPHNTVGIGDAENDHAFLSACECGVAVANALDSVKARVDWVTPSDHGDGAIELIDRMIESDLKELSPKLTRHDIVMGKAEDDADVRLASQDGVVLIAGPSGAGKTMVTTTLLERLSEAALQFCVIDPEGDYDEFEDAIALRGSDRRALADEAVRVLDHPTENVIVNLMDLRLDDRPEFLPLLLPRLLEMRAASARPHWIVIDEAHHLLPASRQVTEAMLPARPNNIALVTVHPDHVSQSVVKFVQSAIIVGREAQATVDALARGRGDQATRLPAHQVDTKLAWLLRTDSLPLRFRPFEPAADRQRHQRKYAEGELGKDRSFYFRGPDGRLNLRAQNLEVFTQMAEGVDDATWEYHLRRHDVSGWFREMIKDESLAAEAAEIEQSKDLSPSESRARIRDAIERRYTTPA
jgi:hydroxymethylpyrimidine pyrophosphatase-like HAD family hydrolase